MALSIFDIFKIGIGPSSSHTLGPMRAAGMFIALVKKNRCFDALVSIKVELFGSLALTGAGHCTDKAVVLGLEGETAEAIDPATIDPKFRYVQEHKTLNLNQERTIAFDLKTQIKFHYTKILPYHPNGISFTAFDDAGSVLQSQIYYSIGGGHVVTDEEAKGDSLKKDDVVLPLRYRSADELLAIAADQKLTIAEILLTNETVWNPREVVLERIDRIWREMSNCIERGCQMTGTLPGRLKVKRRAHQWLVDLNKRPASYALSDPLEILDWVNLFALAVNEENACGSKVVTAPTNGAAGIIPAVGKYYERFSAGADHDGVRRYLLTAAAIGILYIENASISGAEVGCQGEVGVACSMAAGGLVAALNGSVAQVEQAAEIGMEHNLGLTCDPIGGLVQIPCIERNAMGAVKAINAARIALRGDGHHYVSLDSVIKTMRQTGKDMNSQYKETSQGGLAVNVIEC